MADPVTWAIIIGTVASASASVMSAEATKGQADLEAEAEGERAESERAQRMHAMRGNLASHTAAASVSGVKLTSASTMATSEDIKRQHEIGMASAQTQSQYRISSAKARGKNARLAGYVGATGTLLEGGAAATKAYRSRPKSKSGGGSGYTKGPPKNYKGPIDTKDPTNW